MSRAPRGDEGAARRAVSPTNTCRASGAQPASYLHVQTCPCPHPWGPGVVLAFSGCRFLIPSVVWGPLLVAPPAQPRGACRDASVLHPH